MNTFLTLVGIAGGLLTTWLGMEKQEKAYEKESLKEEERYQTELGFTKEDRALKKQALEYQKKQDAKIWKWKEEEKNYSRGKDMVNQFTSLLQQEPALKNNFMSVWNR